jgi:hypothetical protein
VLIAPLQPLIRLIASLIGFVQMICQAVLAGLEEPLLPDGGVLIVEGLSPYGFTRSLS